MKIPSTTFLCDATGCKEAHTVMHGEEEPTAAHLALVEAGWRVNRRSFKGWQHFCTLHTDEATR